MRLIHMGGSSMVQVTAPSSGAARHLLPQGEKGSTENSSLHPLLPLREKVPEGRMRGFAEECLAK
jgi:hypothetical protein